MSVDAQETRFTRLARWGLLLCAAATPLYVVRWHVGPIPTTLLEAIILLTLGAYLLSRFETGAPWLVRTGYEIPILLLLLAGAIGIFVAPNHRAALGIYRAYFVEPIAIFYVAVELWRERRHFELVLVAFGIGAVWLSLLNIAIFIVAYRQNNIHLGAAPVALNTSANATAMFLEPRIALAVAFVLFAVRPLQRWVALAVLAVTGLAMLLSFSRGGYLALTVLALIAILSVRRKLELLASTAIAAVLVSRIPLVRLRLAHQLDPTYPQNTFLMRVDIWRAALQMLRDHPVFGAGISEYQQTVFKYVPPGGEFEEIYPHNLWLTFWSETGLLGLAAFSYILFRLLYVSWRAIATARDLYRPLLWGLFGGLVVTMVHGLVDSPYWKNDLSLQFWMFAALILAGIGANRVESGQLGVRKREPRASALA